MTINGCIAAILPTTKLRCCVRHSWRRGYNREKANMSQYGCIVASRCFTYHEQSDWLRVTHYISGVKKKARSKDITTKRSTLSRLLSDSADTEKAVWANIVVLRPYEQTEWFVPRATSVRSQQQGQHSCIMLYRCCLLLYLLTAKKAGRQMW